MFLAHKEHDYYQRKCEPGKFPREDAVFDTVVDALHEFILRLPSVKRGAVHVILLSEYP